MLAMASSSRVATVKVAARRSAATRVRHLGSLGLPLLPIQRKPSTLLSATLPFFSNRFHRTFPITGLGINARLFHASPPSLLTLNQSMKRKKLQPKRQSKSPALEGCYQRKGVCVSVFTRKPKKPNSGERRVTRVKLTTGRTVDCYIPGEGHNLQEHSVVLIRGGRAQDLPGVRYKVIRGALDCGGVINRAQARSKYGAKRPKKS